MSADLALINGNVITVDQKDRVAEAVAVKSGKIIRVGRSSEVKELTDSKTKIIDLRGKTVTPGMIDVHNHFAMSGINEVYVFNLRYPKVKSIKEVLRIVKEEAERTAPGKWVQGRGWDEALFDERRYVDRWDLDSVSPRNPVMLTHTSGHYIAVNSFALQRAGITRETPEPRGGTIVRDPKTGEPTGVLKEEPAMNLVKKVVPAWSVEETERGISRAQELVLTEGITTIKDPGVDDVSLKAYRNLRRRGELRVRAYLLYKVDTASQTLDAVKRLKVGGDNTLWLGGLKMFLDGSGMGRTAWMYRDWNKNFRERDVGNKGYPVTDPGEFKRMVKTAHEAGFQIGTHAIGDRAIDYTLDVYEEALRESPSKTMRHTIIHSNAPTPKALEKMKQIRNNLAIETQSPFLYFIGDSYAGNFGPSRSKRMIPLRSYAKLGITVGNSADWFVCPFPPRFGIWAAMERRTWKETYGPHPFSLVESVTAREALRTYTAMAARCLLMEDRLGSIELGKYADLVVWSDDLYSVPTHKIRDLSVEMTIVGGKIEHLSPTTTIEA